MTSVCTLQSGHHRRWNYHPSLRNLSPSPTGPLAHSDHFLSSHSPSAFQTLPGASKSWIFLEVLLRHELASSLIGFTPSRSCFLSSLKSQLSPSPFSNFQIFLGIFSLVVISSAILFLSYTLSEFLNFFTVILEESGDLRKAHAVSSYLQMSFQVVCTLSFFIHLLSSVVLLVCLCECF